MEVKQAVELLRVGENLSEEDAPGFYQSAISFIFGSLVWTSRRGVKAVEDVVFALGRSEKHRSGFSKLFAICFCKVVGKRLSRYLTGRSI